MNAGLDALAPLPAPAGTDPQRVVDSITAQARSSFATGLRVRIPSGRLRLSIERIWK